MRKATATSAIALVLAASWGSILALQSVANADHEKWEGNFRQCHIRKWFSKEELAEIGWQRDSGQTIVIKQDEIGDIEKALQLIKKCKAFYKCLDDREAGRVKRCNANDRRWR